MTQSSQLPKRWFVPYPEKKSRAGHPCQIACGGSQKMGFLLHYFLYEASWELERQNLPESCKVVVLTRSHKEILQQVNISQKSLIEFLKTFNEWGFVLNERYSKTFAVQHDPIHEAMHNPKSCKVYPATSTFLPAALLQEIEDLKAKSCKVEAELKQLQQVQLYNFSLEARLEAISQEIEDLKAKSCKVYPNVEALQLYNFSSDWLQAVSDALGIPFPSRDIERDITKENIRDSLGDFVVTSSCGDEVPDAESHSQRPQAQSVTAVSYRQEGYTHAHEYTPTPHSQTDVTDTPEQQGEANDDQLYPDGHSIGPGNHAVCPTQDIRQDEIVSHSQMDIRNDEIEDDDETLHRLPKVTLNGVCHDDTPATTHPSVPVGSDRSADLSLARGSTPGMVSRQSTLQAGHVSSLQVQQGQEATQVQVIPSQQTVPVPPAAVPPSLHPSQQATNAPVASVPPDREQRGAGETYDTPEAWEAAQKAMLSALKTEWDSLSKSEKTTRGGRWDTYKKQQWDAWKALHPKPKDEALDEACSELYHKIVTQWRGYEWDSGKAITNERIFIRNFCLKYRRDHQEIVTFFGQIVEHMTTKTFKWSQESYRYKWSASDVYHETDAILQLWKNPPKPNGKPAYNGNGKGHLTPMPKPASDIPTFTAADYDRLRSMPV